MSMFLFALLAASLTMSGVIVLLWLADKLLSRKISAACRYYMWLIVLAGRLIPFRPDIPIPFESIPIAPLFKTPYTAVSADEPEQSKQIEMSGETPQAVSTKIPNSSAYSPLSEKRPIDYSLILFAVWIAAALSIFAYHLRAYVKFVFAVHRWSSAAEDERVLPIIRAILDDMSIKRQKVTVKTCALVSSPMLIGFQKPVILLPEKFIASDELAHIIRHELTHYKRGDMWMNLLRLLVTSMHWFNPFVYLMGRIIRTDCEASCDELVVTGSDAHGRKRYGETIIGFIGTQSTQIPVLSTYFYGGRTDMKKRLFSIMDMGRKSKLWAAACVTAVAVMTLLSGNAFAASTGTVQYIGEAGAKTIALTDAGITESQANSIKIEFDYGYGIAEYDVELRYGQIKYDYEINALSGDILSRKQETKTINTFTPAGYTAGTAVGENTAEDKSLDIVGAGSAVLSETKYKKDGHVEYKITAVSGDIVYKIELYGDGTLKKMEQENVTGTGQNAASYANNVKGYEEAVRIALEKSGGGTVIKCKLDYKKEGLRYEVKIINNSVEYKIKMNAETGEIYDYSFKSK